jgi:ribosomal protein S18 acetylase RimI-like enzyme
MPLVHELFLEYAGTLEFDLAFQGFEGEVQSLPGIYSPPKGCVLLAFQESKPAGCVALKAIDDEISEMKRLYVRKQFQGQGIGRALATAAIARAQSIGYKKIRLDTVPSMKAALQMYKSMGFYPISPYRENPVPGTSYLELEVGSRSN